MVFHRSFYLAEVAIILAIVGLLTSVVVYSTIRQINRGRAKGVTADLERLAQAALSFRLNSAYGTANITDLQPQYIPAGFNLTNCFGQPYWINVTNTSARAGTNVQHGTVTPDMAKSLAISVGTGPNGTDQVEAFESVNFGAATNAAWEKKNIY